MSGEHIKIAGGTYSCAACIKAASLYMDTFCRFILAETDVD